MKQIVISIYDSSYGWSFMINENEKQKIIHRGEYDDWKEDEELEKHTTEFERHIAEIVRRHAYGTYIDDLIKELNASGYDVIFDEDGYIEFYGGQKWKEHIKKSIK